MNSEKIENVVIENAEIVFKNFSGKPGKFNANGEKSFCVILNRNAANDLKRAGWNVKEFETTREHPEVEYYLKVKLGDGFRFPNIINDETDEMLSPEAACALDSTSLTNVRISIRPYQWERPDGSGVTAYLKKMNYRVDRSKMLSIDDAEILFRNFSGAESKFNRAGNRNFCVIIDDPDAVEQLVNDGWNVKILAPRDEDDTPRHYIQVSVRFDNYPPAIHMYSGNVDTELSEDTVGCLDYADISRVDVDIKPSAWTVNGKSGLKAYLHNMRVILDDDRNARVYDNSIDDEVPFN